MKAVYLES
jgi:COP9 signalosome complex subunit 2